MTSWAPFGPFSTHSHFVYFKPFSFRSTELVQDKEKAFNPILVKFRLFDQKVKIMKRWKILKANTIGKDVEKVNKKSSSIYPTKTIFTIQDNFKRLMGGV